jgi:uncharacterized delta-60 repeat protein
MNSHYSKSLFRIFSLVCSCFLLWSNGLKSQSQWLDPAFGEDGIVTATFNNSYYNEMASRIAIQEDGKIVITGDVSGSYGIPVMRFDQDGTIDSTFGTDGRVLINISGFYFMGGRAINVLNSGKILLAGDFNDIVCLFQINEDGTMDESFGNGGIVQTALGSILTVNDIEIYPDNRIAVTGSITISNPVFRIFISRYNQDGLPDNSFGTDGVVIFDAGGLGCNTGLGKSLSLQSDNKLVVTGTYDMVGNSSEFFSARFSEDGSLDNTYGEGGYTIVDLNICLGGRTSLIQPDDKIVLYAFSQDPNYNYFHSLMRFDTDGTLDETFGNGGIVTHQASNTYDIDVFNMALQSDGKFLLTGYGTDATGNTGTDFGLRRFNQDGSIDSLFGNNGVLLTDIFGNLPGANNDYSVDVMVQEDNKILLTGNANTNTFGSNDFAIMRILPEPTISQIKLHPESESLNVYPNPFKNNITLEYTLVKDDIISIFLYDMIGNKVQTLCLNEKRNKGQQKEVLHPDPKLTNGLYMLILSNSESTLSIKLSK